MTPTGRDWLPKALPRRWASENIAGPPMALLGFDVYGTLVDPLGMDAPLRAHVRDLAEPDLVVSSLADLVDRLPG